MVAGVFFASFYLLFMRITRKRVRTINEVSKETSQGLNRLVQQFIAGMRDIKVRDAGPFFFDKVDAALEPSGEGVGDERVDQRISPQLDRADRLCGNNYLGDGGLSCWSSGRGPANPWGDGHGRLSSPAECPATLQQSPFGGDESLFYGRTRRRAGLFIAFLPGAHPQMGSASIGAVAESPCSPRRSNFEILPSIIRAWNVLLCRGSIFVFKEARRSALLAKRVRGNRP